MFAHRLMQHAFIAGTAVAFAAGLVGYFLSPARLALLGDLDEPVPGRRRRADRRGDLPCSTPQPGSLTIYTS
jgi:hypothetical protein